MVNHCHLATKTSACCPFIPLSPHLPFFLSASLSLSFWPVCVCNCYCMESKTQLCTQINTQTHVFNLHVYRHTCIHAWNTHTPYGCIIIESEAALRNNYRGWLLLLLLIPTNKPVHKQDAGVRSRSSHFCDTAPSPSYPCVLVSFWFVFIWTNESTQTPKCCTQDLYLYRAKSQQKLPQSPLYCKLKAIW